MEKIIRKNLNRRGMDKINLFGEFEKGAIDLLSSTTVMIVTGFVIKDKLIGETDGPIGAISLASALEKLGKKVIIVTDKYSKNILFNCSLVKGVKAIIESVPYIEAEEFCYYLLEKYKPSHIVSIERPGRSDDGFCYSMRGEKLSDVVPNTDVLFQESMHLGITTLAVGDGGNEVGMGKVSSFVRESVEQGDIICASISTDYLIVAGVSNWGGHALCAALSILTSTMLLHDNEIEIEILKSMVNAGAVDGCTKRRTMTVDGISLEENIEILEKLRSVVKSYFNIAKCVS
ncbi:DUF4392 domain-containing protein [Clostridium sediminicola]|uniref:DUF4392 domain-containing protein n=1 Tax=Clostridium sediminicola TaxID=3114879 RepID=UPI0031F22EC0